jgi:1-pyrroline-5-carboxylate dehydrogenase
MTDARAVPPQPRNEPVRDYAPGSGERASLQERLLELQKETVDAPCVIGGREVRTGETFDVRAPHDHALHLATVHAASPVEVDKAIEAAAYAKPEWAALAWEDRAAVFLRAAELIAGPYRDSMNAATMLGQSKTVMQAEIDAACELIDFLRFNVAFYSETLAEQPFSGPGVWNRIDYRPLEGFVLAMTPFNFTAIAGNLPTAPALVGNTVVWKPSEKQAFAAHVTMEVLREAGLPDGVINLVHGDGAEISEACFDHPDFTGLHFTGSLPVLRSLWSQIGRRLATYRGFPRIVGETGGKDFVIAHPSADVERLRVALVRGAFEYQGQKCSAASRAYLPRSVWDVLEEPLVATTRSLPMGDVADLSNFMGAVIDEGAFKRLRHAIAMAEDDPATRVIVGGGSDDRTGWFVEPTIVVSDDPRHHLMETELFGPFLTVHVYDDGDWEHMLDLVDTTSPYGLTGAVFATDRHAIDRAQHRLRHAAGNFYVNDKPTGAVVSQQPFGGARASGTNDKAGSRHNLMRWISLRAIKENLEPPTDHIYPHMWPGS